MCGGDDLMSRNGIYELEQDPVKRVYRCVTVSGRATEK